MCCARRALRFQWLKAVSITRLGEDGTAIGTEILTNGTPVPGYWQFRASLSAAERSDGSHLPSKVYIMITVKHQ